VCGRFTLTSQLKELQEQFAAGNHISYRGSYNIPPSSDIPAVRQTEEGRELFLCNWGLIPHWAKPENKRAAINARAETLASKPYFREAYKKRRCLIPVNGFYEWQSKGKAKLPYFIHLPDRPLFAFAGIWEYRQQQDQHIDSCAIITTDANTTMQAIHDRMPVILMEKDYSAWLDTGDIKYLGPYPGKMEYYAVSRAVNNPRNDSRELIDREK